MLAYLMTQEKMRFRKLIYRYFIVTMYFSAGLIPWYITMKTYGLQNNFLLYVVPGAINPFYMILIKTYIESLPKSIEESAQIDGAGFLHIFIRIILFLSKPILATIAIFAAVGYWNAWQDNFFLVRDGNLQTLQLILYNYLQTAQQLANLMHAGGQGADPSKVKISADTIRMTMVVITITPIMLVYPFLQKHFAKGIMLGAVKG